MPERTRDVAIQIRVTKEEKRLMEQQAHRENYATLSDFIRKTILDRCKSLLKK